MGFFTSKKVFRTSQQIKEALFKIESLDYQQRARVFEALVNELDDGGVTKEEVRLAILELRRNREISEVDQKNLLQLVKD
ncbi:hypothetical protein HYZ76_02305 [Candidatus Falkowbacteria bacterium]|nr:hypothetical protein [Candidatus Falkowbacteria bacterium]